MWVVGCGLWLLWLWLWLWLLLLLLLLGWKSFTLSFWVVFYFSMYCWKRHWCHIFSDMFAFVTRLCPCTVLMVLSYLHGGGAFGYIWISRYCLLDIHQGIYVLFMRIFPDPLGHVFFFHPTWLYFGSTPHPGCTSPPGLWTIFRFGNPNLNLHLWLASWVGGRPKLY